MDLTISHITEEEIGTEDEPKRGFVMHWHEQEKPMCINVTNANIIAGILGSEDTDHWSGQRICLYNDPGVMYKGKRTGGIRIRPASNHPAPHQVHADPRQTPPPNTYQQAQQHARPQAPAYQPPPAAPRPLAPAYQAPRPPAPAYALPTPQPYAPPAAPAEDAPWPGDGQM